MNRLRPCLRARLGCLVILVLAPNADALFAQDTDHAGSEWDVVRVPPRVGKQIDFLFRRWERDGSPGAAVGIVDGGELVYARGYGLADLEHGVPISPRTVFHVASLSKQFTALAIGLLAEKGALALDDELRDHIPEFPDLGYEITLRHLIHHTSGIRDQWSLLTLAGWRLDDVITRADILGLLVRQRELNFEPGTEYMYSNSGYMLLAEVVDRVTGKSFREWTTAEIFEPLEMRYTHAHDDHQMIVPNRAESYSRRPGGSHQRSPLNYATVGATSLLTTVDDMARWASTFMAQSFAPDVLKQMVEPTILDGGAVLDYGFGLSLGEVTGRRVVQHGGADAGFRSHFLVFPDDDVAVIVLGNEAQIDAGRLAHRAAQVYLGSKEPLYESGEIGTLDAGDRPSDDPAAERADPASVGIDEEEMEPLLGPYWSPVLDNVRDIRLSSGELLYDRGAGNTSKLRYMGGSVFRMVGVEPPLEVRFERSGEAADSARTDIMVVRPNPGPEILFSRVEPVRDSLPVDDYLGVFGSEEVGVAVRIIARDDGIALRHPRHGTIPLRPVVHDRFDSAQWWLGTLRFTRDEQGRVVGFRSTSGRIRHLLFERDDAAGGTGRFRSSPGPR